MPLSSTLDPLARTTPAESRACMNACRRLGDDRACHMALDLCGLGPKPPGPQFVQCMTQNLNLYPTPNPGLAVRQAASICSRPLATPF